MHEIIFEADTPAGKAFDVALLACIVLSVVVVMLESVADIRAAYGGALRAAEWGLTIAFTIEYVLRLLSVQMPLRYAVSFFGVVDLLAVLPTYVSVIIPGAHSLLVIRTLRLLRIFRVLKLARYVGAGQVLLTALRGARSKIVVFLWAVLSLVVIIGSVMYLIEGEANGFTSIPRSIYWAVVTITTVGYGDIAPQTVAGQTLASLLMIVGYGIIAIPTGIMTVELAHAQREPITTQACPACGVGGHAHDARFCRRCGAAL